MAIRANGPLAGFGWLKRGVNLGHDNARAVFGGAALVLCAALVPSLVTFPLQWGAMRAGTAPSPTIMLGAMAVSMLLGLLLVPVYVGYLRLIDAVEHGKPARAREVFAPYREGEVLRFAGYGLAMLAVYVAGFALALLSAGGGLASWYMQVLTAQANGQSAAVPALPSGVGIALLAFAVIGLLLMGIYAISLGQVALRGRSVLGALGDGFVGSVKNLLPLLAFAVALFAAWIVVAIVVALAAGLLALLGKLVGTWLMLALIVPLYVALVLVALAVMFGAMYHLWRDVCGDAPGTTSDTASAIAV